MGRTVLWSLVTVFTVEVRGHCLSTVSCHALPYSSFLDPSIDILRHLNSSKSNNSHEEESYRHSGIISPPPPPSMKDDHLTTNSHLAVWMQKSIQSVSCLTYVA